MKNSSRFLSLSVASILLFAGACAGPGTAPLSGGSAAGGQGFRGKLVFEGVPLENAYVYAYRNYGTNLLGPSDYASEASAADGSYTLETAAGEFSVVARRRVSGENTGPIISGDLYTVNPNNPVTVRKGQYTTLNLELVKMRDPMFFKNIARQETKTGIRGKILDKSGKPMSWVFAMAYTTADMKRVPEYTSVLTGPDGEFVIYLPKGGTYWVAARKNIRDKPVEGEAYGLYRGSADFSIKVPANGFAEGVTIRMEEYRKGIQN